MISNQLDYKEGITFSGLPFWVGLSLIIFSTFIFITNETTISRVLSISCASIGFLSLLSIRGILFNFETKKALKYVNFLVFKLKYMNMDLQNMQTIELRLFSENQGMNMLSISTTVRTKVYELYLTENSKKRTLVAESTDYSKAIQLMNKLSEGLNIVAENKYEEWKLRMRGRRRK